MKKYLRLALISFVMFGGAWQVHSNTTLAELKVSAEGLVQDEGLKAQVMRQIPHSKTAFAWVKDEIAQVIERENGAYEQLCNDVKEAGETEKERVRKAALQSFQGEFESWKNSIGNKYRDLRNVIRLLAGMKNDSPQDEAYWRIAATTHTMMKGYYSGCVQKKESDITGLIDSIEAKECTIGKLRAQKMAADFNKATAAAEGYEKDIAGVEAEKKEKQEALKQCKEELISLRKTAALWGCYYKELPETDSDRRESDVDVAQLPHVKMFTAGQKIREYVGHDALYYLSNDHDHVLFPYTHEHSETQAALRDILFPDREVVTLLDEVKAALGQFKALQALTINFETASAEAGALEEAAPAADEHAAPQEQPQKQQQPQQRRKQQQQKPRK